MLMQLDLLRSKKSGSLNDEKEEEKNVRASWPEKRRIKKDKEKIN